MQQDSLRPVEFGDDVISDEISSGNSDTAAWQSEDGEEEFTDVTEFPVASDDGGLKILGTDFARKWFPRTSDLPVVTLTHYQNDPKIPGLLVGNRDCGC